MAQYRVQKACYWKRRYFYANAVVEVDDSEKDETFPRHLVPVEPLKGAGWGNPAPALSTENGGLPEDHADNHATMPAKRGRPPSKSKFLE